MNEEIQISFTKEELSVLMPLTKDVADQTKKVLAGLYGDGKINLEGMLSTQKIIDGLVEKLQKYFPVTEPKKSRFQQKLDDYLKWQKS